MSELRTKVRTDNIASKIRCLLCGETYEPGRVVCSLYEDNEKLGDSYRLYGQI